MTVFGFNSIGAGAILIALLGPSLFSPAIGMIYLLNIMLNILKILH